MTAAAQLICRLHEPKPILALAPMQDISDLRLWNLLMTYDGPDLFYTEYFRVHVTSRPDKSILHSITAQTTGRPVIAQVIGENIPALVRTVEALQRYPIAAIDLNLGCPAPIVCRKHVGGALLRNLPKIDAILGALRAAVAIPFTVKCRIGFDTPEPFDSLLKLLIHHGVDLVTVHGRTVRGGYTSPVSYAHIAQAARILPCPVLANGDICSADQAQALLAQMPVRGLMMGRGAIRNPWLFRQIRQRLAGQKVDFPTGREVLDYLRKLWEATQPPQLHEAAQVEKIKKYANFIGLGIDTDGQFLHAIRRARTPADFFRIGEEFLDHDRPLALEPFGDRQPNRTVSASANSCAPATPRTDACRPAS
jgi:tRNA-dihydrouridine synthase B